MSKSLSERLRNEADVLDRIQNFDGRYEAEEAAADASKYREIADALDAKDALLREAREVLKRSGTFALDQNALTLGLAIGTILFKIDEAQK